MKPLNLFKSNGTKIFTIFMVFLTISNLLLLIFAIQLFPAYGGFTRQIIFVKPNSDQNQDGYFIIFDELAEKSQEHDIDWLLHTRGEVSIEDDRQTLTCSVPSYINDETISLQVAFLEKIDKIETSTGYFFPENYREDYPYEDYKTSQIQAKYQGKNNPLMATVLYPKNDSNALHTFPTIQKEDNGLKRIGSSDLLYYDMESSVKKFSNPSLEFEGRLFFLRQNSSESTKLDYSYLQDAEELTYENTNYFSSSTFLDYILINYANSSQVSGYINLASESEVRVSLFSPFSTIKTFQLNGKETDYSQEDSKISFSVEESTSFAFGSIPTVEEVEKDPLESESSELVKPKKNEWEYENELLDGKAHPYILYNQKELRSIRLKLNDSSKPWKHWYGNYSIGVDDLLTVDVDKYDIDERDEAVNKLSLKYALDGGKQYLDKLEEFLLYMKNIDHYSQDLRRAYAVQAYALAFDMVYNNLSKDSRERISDYLQDHAAPLMRMDLYHDNNHRVVDAGALGVAGLVLNNQDYINTAIETFLHYFYDVNPKDGGSFEGHSYISFALVESMPFMIGLKRANAYNLFTDPKALVTFEYLLETLSPLGMPPLFEDAKFTNRIHEALLIAGANLNETHPLKAQHCQYIWQQRYNNSQYEKATENYQYLLAKSPNFRRILCYNVNSTLETTPLLERKEIWKESAMAFFRGGEDPKGIYMPFSCKNYDQNHPHQDENSFELWAYGAYLINNPGYPGWGKDFHTWSQSSEGSNTLLIGGSDQLQVAANGLTGSISSPYFSMVIGDATEIYNDLGHFQYAPEAFLLLIVNFIFLGISSVLFFQIKSNEGDEGELVEHKENEGKNHLVKRKESKNKELKQQKGKQQTDDGIQENWSKFTIIKNAFVHPFSLTEDLANESLNSQKQRKFLKLFIRLFLSGLMLLIFIILTLEVKTTVDYHSVYHEDKYNIVFDILPFLIWGILTVGALLIFFITYGICKLFARLNTFFLHNTLHFEHTERSDQKMVFVSTLSFLWIFPMIIFAGILFHFTTIQGLQEAIHGLWTELNSINDVYQFFVVILIGIIRNFAYILLFEVPFLLLTIKIFTVGAKHVYSKISREKIQKQAWKIPIMSILIILVVIFLFYVVLYIIFKSVFTFITIEAIVE
mgnify:CR=1 FL=1